MIGLSFFYRPSNLFRARIDRQSWNLDVLVCVGNYTIAIQPLLEVADYCVASLFYH